MSVYEHKQHARQHLRVAVITASDTRTPENDSSGTVIRDQFEAAGHKVEHYEIVPDDARRIAAVVQTNLDKVDAIVITGGTGIASRDCTIEAIRPLLTKELDGFGELFRMLSYHEVGSAALMSRALGGVSGKTFIAALPGSTAACRLAMQKLILPEIGHIAELLTS